MGVVDTVPVNGVDLLCKSRGDGAVKILACAANVARIISGDEALSGRVGYNVLSHQVYVRGDLPWHGAPGPRQWVSADSSQLLVYIDERYGISVRQYLRDGLKAAAMRAQFNPVVEYLDGVTWDGEPRVDSLLADCLGADRSDYNSEAMLLFMRGAIHRARRPGCKFDYMLTLLGGQGIGKSSFLGALCHDRSWYNDNFSSIDGDAALEKLRGKWILELAELLATRKNRDVEAIKSFLTSQTDTFRTRYEQFAEDHPRGCVFAATTNNSLFLTDRTGNRRYLLVECGKYAPTIDIWSDDFDEYVDQCWAEAVARDDDSPLVLSERSRCEQQERLESHEEEDIKIGLVHAYLDAHQDRRVCVPELLRDAIEIDYRTAPRYLVSEIHAIVQAYDGWEPIGTKGGRTTTREFGKQRCYEYRRL